MGLAAPLRRCSKQPQPSIEAEQQLAGGLGIQSIPTLMMFRDGILMYRNPGALSKDVLADLIAQIAALDMDKVRAELAEQEAEAAE